MTAAAGLAIGAAAVRRRELTGKQGVSALMENKKAFFIAIFASFGGLLYGYQQGVLGQALVMPAFKYAFPSVDNASSHGWLTSILQLGGWGGALVSGVLCEVFSRKHTLFFGSLWMILGSYLAAGAPYDSPGYLFAGRFFTGIGVGTLSAIGPLYNAELAPPEVRGFLVALQQLTTTIGIFLAYWIGYGSNFIDGNDNGQSEWAWRIPMTVQGIPAVILAIGVWFMPYSPRLLMNKGRDEKALSTLSYLRNLPEDHELIQIEYLEIKAEVEFEKQTFAAQFPHLAGDQSVFRRELAQYTNIFRTKDSFKRVAIGSLVMFFQQWSGIDSIIYYAPIIFQSLGLTSATTSLLATGITGAINVAVTIPAILVIDRVGRKPLALASTAGMFICQVVVGVIVATCSHDWSQHAVAGWVAVVFVWLYIANFAYGIGPVSWTLIAEIFPLSIRAKGTSISASSNWANNLIIAFITPPMLEAISYGTYLFFAAWLLIGGLFYWFFVPETRGKTLEEMDAAFGSHTSQADLDNLAAIQQRIGLVDLLAPENRRGSAYEMSKKPDVADAHVESTSV